MLNVPMEVMTFEVFRKLIYPDAMLYHVVHFAVELPWKEW